jgi:hypothetical protein
MSTRGENSTLVISRLTRLKIDELLLLGSPVRYTCYIQDGSDGHTSIVNNVAIYKAKKGDIYEWPQYDAWHAGGNCGLHDKFMFNFWGYK